jgi:hypothetical protein
MASRASFIDMATTALSVVSNGVFGRREIRPGISKAAEDDGYYAGWLRKYDLVATRGSFLRGSNIGGQQPLLLNFTHPAPAGQRRELSWEKALPLVAGCSRWA